MKKYYFVVYLCEKHGCRTNFALPYRQALLGRHPLQWQLDCNESYKNMETYTVLSWQEISEEEFNTFNGYIG
jgi:hypothetical protein